MNKKALLIINIVATVILIATLTLVFYVLPSLPQTIPTHFDAEGNPNGYGGRSSLFIIYGICIFLYATMIFLQKKPHLMKTAVMTDKAGEPINLTKTQIVRIMNLNAITMSASMLLTIALVCVGLLSICNLLEFHHYYGWIYFSATVVIIAIYYYKLHHMPDDNDDYIKAKIESCHSLFLEKADNSILEQLRIINGNEYLPENKRLQLINDIKSTHGEVAEYIRKTSPTISDDDITYCLLCSIGLNNNSISTIMASSEEALRKRKSRIRKKLPDSLAAYLLDERRTI